MSNKRSLFFYYEQNEEQTEERCICEKATLESFSVHHPFVKFAMSIDEGPSSASQWWGRGSSSQELSEFERPPGTESFASELSVSPFSYEIPFPDSDSALKNMGRPPSLFDNYKVIGGVPAFVFETEYNRKLRYRKCSVSSDGSRIVVVSRNYSICVYNLLDNCSLVAKGRDICQDHIYFVSFWNDRNDQFVIISRKRHVIIVSIEKEDYTKFGTSENVKTIVTNVLRMKHNFKLDREGDYYFFSDAFVDGATLWVAAKEKTNGVDFITISRVTEDGYVQVKNFEESFKSMFGKQLRLGKNAGIVTPRRAPSRGDITHVLSKLDYENGGIQTTPPINGKLVTWDRETNNFLIWRLQDDQHLLDLYSFEVTNCKAPLKVSTFELGKGLIDVKCSFLNRELWPFNEVEEMRDVDSPLVCVVSFKSSASILSTWDTHANKILKQIDVTIDEMQISYDSQIDFSPSPDMNWFTLGCSKSGIVALFSFSSEVMVWSTKLESQELGEYNSVFLQFDALSSKLLIFDSDVVRICVPPCLVKDFDLELKCANIMLERKEEQIMNLRECHARLMSQNTLLYLSWSRDIDFQNFYSMVRVAVPYATSEIAFMFPKEGDFSIIFVSVLDVLSPPIMNLLYESLLKRNVDHSFQEIKLHESKNVLESTVPFYFFLYPDKERTTDSIVIFWLYRHRMDASFVTLDGAKRELVPFIHQRNVLCCFQSKDGFRVTCLKRYDVSVVDLEQRVVINEVGYQVDLPLWLYKFCREKDFKFKRWAIGEDSPSEDEYSTNGSKDSKTQDNDELVEKWVGLMQVFLNPPDVSNNGTAILLGWIRKANKPLLLTPMTQIQELEEISTQENEIMPCWALDENFKQFSFLEYDETLNSINTIGISHKIGEHYKRYGKSDWTLQLASILKKLNSETLGTLDMKLDNNSGTLWITTLSIATDVKLELSFLPLGPYAMNDTLPCLHTLDDRANLYSAYDLDKLTCQFGASVFNMPFNGITNLHHAITRKNMDITVAISKSTHKHNIKLGLRSHQHNCSENKRNFLEEAIDRKSEDLVRGVLQLYQEQQIPFDSASFIMKSSFQNLWTTNQVQLKALLTKDLLAWDICSFDIFFKMLNEYNHGKVLVGTLNDPLTWRQKSNEEAMIDILKLSDSRSKQNDAQNIRDTKISVVMKVFCLDDVCKVGTNGILRYLLTQRVPSYLFKTPLLKWTILWKWEHMWKKNSLWSLFYFVLMLGVFTTYVICYGLYKDKLKEDLNVQVWLTFTLVVLVLITIYMWFQEVKEIKTYHKDGKLLFPNMRYGGIWYYWSSGWNILENIIYFLLLFVIAPLHFASFLTTSHIPILSTILAMESILMWFKIWYYAQAFTKTGAFVLMIENVIRDCLPFLMLSGIVLVGFSLALFTLFQQSLHQENSNGRYIKDIEEIDGESTLDIINASFGSPIMAMLTLFYAMIGTFDVEIYSNSGNLSPLIIFVFVLYLSIQAIVMFNMLIAIMSDTFDRVKSTEEEQLLMGRARFIDACEAALSERQIKEMEKSIGKYLYVVLPKDGDSHNENDLWKGRVRSMEDNVRNIVAKFQAEMMEVTKNNRSMLEGTIQSDIKTLEKSMKNDICVLEEAIKANKSSLEESLQSRIGALEETINVNISNLKDDIDVFKTK